MKKFSAERLRRARVARGVSADFLGAAIGRNGQTVINWESGHGEPTATNLHNLAVALKKTKDYFFETAAIEGGR